MIQPSAPSAKSSLATAAGMQPGTAESGGIPDGFAALLALGLPEGEEAKASAGGEGELTASLLRQLTGKTGGKNLPDGLPDDLADEAAIADEDTKDASGDADTDEEIAGIGIAQIPVVPVQAPSQKAIEAVAAALDKPQSASDKSQIGANRADVLTRFSESQVGDAQAKTTLTATTDATSQARPTIAPDTTVTAETVPVVQPQAKGADAGRTAQDPAITAKLVASTPPPASSATQQPADVAVQVSVNLPKFPGAPLQSLAQTEKTGEVSALPVNTNSRDAQVSQPGAAALRPAVETTQTNAAAVPAELAQENNAEQPAAASARPLRVTRDDTSPSENRTNLTSQPRAAAAALELAQSDTSVPRAGDLQPLLAVREAQSLVQSTPTAPQTSPTGPAQPGKLDFAAIVDRLVEAREAASPQAVKATIAHSQFGQVSLRFDQNAAGLTVSMTSSDPDFAPAVHAAAASGHSSNANDNGSGAPRQDAPNQQSASLNSGQPQQQSQGSARGGERDRQDSANQTVTHSNQPAQDDTDPAGRNGIYA
ncbi:MAG: hypothetical protein R3E09_07855 [Novosphingobium sp.]|nr:hypothetical protein [Novosphingobium sp.]